MRNRRKTLLRDHSVPEVTLKACLKHTQSQPYLRPSSFEDLKDLRAFPSAILNSCPITGQVAILYYCPIRRLLSICHLAFWTNQRWAAPPTPPSWHRILTFTLLGNKEFLVKDRLELSKKKKKKNSIKSWEGALHFGFQADLDPTSKDLTPSSLSPSGHGKFGFWADLGSVSIPTFPVFHP